MRSTTISTLLTLTTLISVSASKQCIQFDTAGNLYAFGGSSDVNLGGSGSWASPNPQTLTTTGRPPWTGNNTLCLLSQYNNALYVLDADSSNPSSIYVYDFAGQTWSTQTTSSAPDLTTGSTILDHDTNVFFTLPSNAQSLYQLDFSTIKAAGGSSALAWSAVEAPSFSTSGYNPVMAEASNHINFFGVPGTAAGSANLFVIHYSFFQPTAQTYPTVNNGASFPDSHGVAIGVPLTSTDAGDQMVFIPDSFDNTYVITHWTNPSNYSLTTDEPTGISDFINTTQILPAPTSKDTSSSYAAWNTSLVQIDSSGAIYYLDNSLQQGQGFAVGSSPTWTKMSYTLAGLSGSNSSTAAGSSSAAGSGSATSSGASATGSSTAKASGSVSGTASGSAASGAATSKSAATSDRLSVGSQSFAVMAVGAAAGIIGGLVTLL